MLPLTGCEDGRHGLAGPKRDVLLLHERLSLRLDGDGDLIPWEESQEARVPPHDEKPDTRDAREHRPRPAARRGLRR